MHSTVVVLFSLFCIGWSKDITLGNAEGRKIFDEVRQANPAIWRQYENVTVIAPDNELISKVVITDKRPEKDGDVQIVSGGDGQKSVTIELKSPTVLRGYEFHIEVYSMPDTVVTDAEENLNNEDVTPGQRNESTEIPDIISNNNNDDKETQSNESTELPDNVNSKDIKGFPTIVTDDVQYDSNRPARETEDEENNSQTDVPEDKISFESDKSTSESEETVSESDGAIPIEQDITTELPEAENTEADVNPDSIRPARETELHTSVIASAPLVTFSTVDEVTTEASSETPMTDATSEVNDATTTEAITLPSDQATFTPVAFDNSKNIPDYASLNILDYIKNRERPIRRTEDEKHEDNVGTSESSVETDENNDETTPLADETSSIEPEDDTVDLIPPKIDASYNTDFADVHTTANPTEGSVMNNGPRAGRGIDFDSDIEKESTTTSINTDEEYTTTPANADVTTPTLDEDHTTIASLDDQFRNTRDASTDVEDENDVNISGETSQGNVPNEGVVPSVEVDGMQPKRNVIIVNLEEFIARDENNRFMYALPIVLVINSENNNYPIIKIIAENASDDRETGVFPTLSSDESLEPSEFDYKLIENSRIKGDYMPSGDSDQSQ
ncbi:enolase-phosphatase E1-like [Maniola hyperantus]|uniref:enolase-phosphatase E1-like n=1 Tax=Aphantopus hyperantus TaxID=2795564 RepID=UPI001568AA0A|nr:ras guanine nucleotide exchange factor glfB-like [Maniola hyperantus]